MYFKLEFQARSITVRPKEGFKIKLEKRIKK